MVEITAVQVKDLREKTGAGMMDCKKALTEAKGNFEDAVDWLRKKGLAAAKKKEGRVAADGLIAIAVQSSKAAMVEVNSETDFVARNPEFQSLVEKIAKVALTNGSSLDALKTAPYPGSGMNVGEVIIEHIATIGENLNLRRVAALEVGQGVVTTYIHNQIVPGAGKIGVLVALESQADTAMLTTLGKQIAMHIAAAKPEALTTAEVSEDALNREKSIFMEQARNSGKPDNIIEKMVEGRIRKYYEEVVLLEQVFVIDGKTKIADVLAESSKAAGSNITLKGFVRFALGEGIEQEKTDFAQEVAAVVNR